MTNDPVQFAKDVHEMEEVVRLGNEAVAFNRRIAKVLKGLEGQVQYLRRKIEALEGQI